MTGDLETTANYRTLSDITGTTESATLARLNQRLNLHASTS